jgi:hypothetical protein
MPFNVYQLSPMYDGRDGLCGTRTHFVEQTETLAWAYVRAGRLNEEWGDTDLYFEVRDAATNRPPVTPRALWVPAEDPNALPF